MNDSKVDATFFKIKNHPTLSAFIVVGIIVIAISSFTDALKNIVVTVGGLIGISEPADISGYWIGRSSENENPVYFEFKSVEDKLYGSVWLTPTFSMQNSYSGVLNGKIAGNNFTFTTEHEYVKEFGRVDYKTGQRSPSVGGSFIDKYEGEVNEGYITVSRISNGSHDTLTATKTDGFKIKLIGYGHLIKGNPE